MSPELPNAACPPKGIPKIGDEMLRESRFGCGVRAVALQGGCFPSLPVGDVVANPPAAQNVILERLVSPNQLIAACGSIS